jgi:hypothetical protein
MGNKIFVGIEGNARTSGMTSSSPNSENDWFLALSSHRKSRDCALLDTGFVEANNLRLRANMTILGGLHSASIFVGVGIRRDSSLAAQAAPEMGDADQRRDDEVIQVDFEVAILAGLPSRSGGNAT